MIRLLTLGCLLTAGTFCFADQWTFFHPETVLGLSCTARQVFAAAYGEKGHDAWQAEAHAVRKAGEGDWSSVIGEFPSNVKGRHAAEKACFKWMDEASKRVKAAR